MDAYQLDFWYRLGYWLTFIIGVGIIAVWQYRQYKKRGW